MRIEGRDKIIEFGEKYPDAVTPLAEWEETASKAEWKHSPDMKNHFNSANGVKAQTVFNISGNKYRLIARILYGFKTVIVQYVLTHKEYDKEKWKE